MVLAALHLSANHPLPMSELARRVGVTTPTLTSVLSGMVRDELVTRRQDPTDRRTVLIAITQPAIDLLDRLLPVLCRRQARVMAELTDDERRELSRLLAKVRPDCLFPDPPDQAEGPDVPADGPGRE
jgi:DNA-binding MarR family transcriptional regulator